MFIYACCICMLLDRNVLHINIHTAKDPIRKLSLGYLKNICLPRTSSYPWPPRWRTRPQPTPAQWFTFIILPSHHYIIIANKTIEKQKMWRNQLKMINPNLLKNKSYYMNFRHKNTSHILYISYIKFKVQVV